MKIDVIGKKIEIKKEQNKLDRFVIEFTSLLTILQIKHVIASGYAASKT